MYTLEKILSMAEPIPFSGCMALEKTNNTCGYTRFFQNKKVVMGHRLVYELKFGPIPAGLVVCHKCDVTCCVNPDHLFLGTQKDNVRDMIAKGRSKIPCASVVRVRKAPGLLGMAHGNSKLIDDEVLEIRASNKSSKELAQKYNTSAWNILAIKKRTRWKHI